MSKSRFRGTGETAALETNCRIAINPVVCGLVYACSEFNGNILRWSIVLYHLGQHGCLEGHILNAPLCTVQNYTYAQACAI